MKHSDESHSDGAKAGKSITTLRHIRRLRKINGVRDVRRISATHNELWPTVERKVEHLAIGLVVGSVARIRPEGEVFLLF